MKAQHASINDHGSAFTYAVPATKWQHVQNAATHVIHAATHQHMVSNILARPRIPLHEIPCLSQTSKAP